MSKRKRILSISYDEPLLRTRHALLERAGFSVVSAYGFSEVLEALEKNRSRWFDLVVMGHSLPIKDKQAIVAAIHTFSESPILSIRRHGYPPIPEADYSVDSMDGPDELLAAVKTATQQDPKTKPKKKAQRNAN